MGDRILSIAQAAAETPWSESTLYRIAPAPGSPFHKQAGRWVTTESELVEWARRGEKPRTRTQSADPMPAPRKTRGRFHAKVVQLHARRAA